MKRYLDILLPWRPVIADLREQVKKLEVQNGVLKGLLENECAERDKLAKLHDQNKRGVGVLLQFIHRTHHLDTPLEKGTIREVLARSTGGHDSGSNPEGHTSTGPR